MNANKTTKKQELYCFVAEFNSVKGRSHDIDNFKRCEHGQPTQPIIFN